MACCISNIDPADMAATLDGLDAERLGLLALGSLLASFAIEANDSPLAANNDSTQQFTSLYRLEWAD